MEMCYFVECQEVPDGQLMILYSVEMLSASILCNLHESEIKWGKVENTAAKDAYNDFMKDVNS